jgi:hypothetical protein
MNLLQAIFFADHRLYKLEARVLPPNPKSGSGERSTV